MILRVMTGLLAASVGSLAMNGAAIAQDDFRHGLTHWVVEQMPGGTVSIHDGKLVIADREGCTVWLRQKLQAPVTITYQVRASSQGRVSDLNCFWMASDPTNPADLFAPGHGRTGKFSTYDALRTYYVGYGGNANTTTRFRRYDGTGARPLLPEHDLTEAKFLLRPDHVYTITLVAGAEGRVQFLRDGEVVFDWRDPQPLREGWFGFRTVNSQLEVLSFAVHRGTPAAATSR